MFTSSITLIVGVNIGGSVGVQHINSKHGDIDTNGKFLRIVMLHVSITHFVNFIDSIFILNDQFLSSCHLNLL